MLFQFELFKVCGETIYILYYLYYYYYYTHKLRRSYKENVWKKIAKRVTNKKGLKKKCFVVDLNKMEQRERINEMKAFNGNLKPYFQVPISFVHYIYNFVSWIHIKNSYIYNYK